MSSSWIVCCFIRADGPGAGLKYDQNNDDSEKISCFHLIQIIQQIYNLDNENKKINPSEIHAGQGVDSHGNNAENLL
jgi:hypothetical protein